MHDLFESRLIAKLLKYSDDVRVCAMLVRKSIRTLDDENLLMTIFEIVLQLSEKRKKKS